MTVRRIYTLRTAGNSARRITEILNAEGISWKDGTRWTVSRVSAALHAPVYIGYRYDPYYNVWTKGKWEPIVTIEQYAEINGRTPPADGDGL